MRNKPNGQLKRETMRLVAIALLAILPFSASAQSKIYLGEYKFNDPRLYSMDPGGANLEELVGVIPATDWLIVGLQVDHENDMIYWTHGSFNDGRISRANLDGSNREVLIGGLTNPRGLAIDFDAERIYWSDTQDLRMYRANLDGSGMETIINTADQLGRPALDLVNDKIYFGNFALGEIHRANLDGTDLEPVISGLFTPVAIALDISGGKMYWADSDTSFVSNHIARANLNGSGMEILYEGKGTSSGFTGIELDLSAGKLYWCDEITDSERGVWEANLDGTNAVRIFASPTDWNAGAMTLVPAPVDDCLTLSASNLLAGEFAVLEVTGGEPGEEVAILFGLESGQTTFELAGYCAMFDFIVPRNNVQGRVVDRGVFDANGEFSTTVLVPIQARGRRIFLQAAMRNTCPGECMSNLVEDVVK